MSRHHHKSTFDDNGKQTGSVEVPFTDEEETARDAEEQALTDGTPLRVWKNDMAATDADIPRQLEDIYDALQADAQARVPQITRDKITAKKTLRGEKP
jgi:hypothetical protein